MPDQIQPGAALVVGRDDVPGRLWRVRGLDNALVSDRVVPPPPHGFGVHRAQLPVLDWIVDPGLEPAPLLVLADIQTGLPKDDAVIDDQFPLDRGHEDQENARTAPRCRSPSPARPRPYCTKSGRRG